MTIRFDDNGLLPAIVQDARTKEVLTLAYMNEESLEKTKETGETWFYSRSRQELWHKGATSGNTQQVVSITADCDQDALVVSVLPNGPACHTGARSCFNETVVENDKVASVEAITRLEQVIKTRFVEKPEGAYTTYLFEKGVDKIGKKIGEEATEVVIAAKNNDAEELSMEAADLIYHLMVMLENQKVPFANVLEILEQRASK
ncbi:bifunctional phosphoribosyl-AMP cyclohydrolase/phosphoribosyl-ATP pyrophosphatase [Chryseomicrobium excrementi]|uniref:Histidine biosynthesis bifunctional protein HisIE n=1 Tax=Chryseomicrobium excrementi TaxID=2041346 RepID=A0A2M9F141_9BACL|nr:bifunctional phosphoribosyl-AMP cyclohydrolase/phosphoribosyl-ATP diphosphatase HisIE [Chryseomicrobium excrementi]PJK17170.1 bifunctional phosphoribosyl-AMP cyclohydrolase/phosphoribosyl-ATP pyrophosphatase [Chryseomicrobium excrementi]